MFSSKSETKKVITSTFNTYKKLLSDFDLLKKNPAASTAHRRMFVYYHYWQNKILKSKKNKITFWSSEFEKSGLDFFIKLEKKDKFEFLRIILKNEPFRKTNEPDLKLSQDQFKAIIDCFDESEKIRLALIDISYNGLSQLEKYSSTDGLKNQVIDLAKTEMQCYLPAITDEMLKTCVEQKDREELQYLIFTRLSGKFKPIIFKETIGKLTFLLYDPSSDLSDLVNTFKIVCAEQENALLEVGWLEPRKIEFISADCFKNIKPDPTRKESLAMIRHYGGYYFLLRFFAGQTIGYPLRMKFNNGIQVLVNDFKKSDEAMTEYSDNAFSHFDFPAKVVGMVNTKYLEFHPGMGGDLPASAASQVKNVSITKLSI